MKKITRSDYHHDNGFLSRKLLMSFGSVILLSGLGVLFAVKGWNLEAFTTTADSAVTIVLGYVGISTVRSALPEAMSTLRKRDTKATEEDIESFPKEEE